MMKLLSLAVIVSLAAPAAAAPDGHAGVAKPEKRERLICKREAVSGSLVKKKRTCLTEQGWKQAKRYNEENVKEWQEVVSSTPTSG